MQIAVSARGLAIGDYDDDGDLDLLVTAMDSPPLLLRNDTPRSGHWLKLRPLNRHGSPAIGARVTFSAGGKSQTREVRSGSSHQSQNAFELHCGLGPPPRSTPSRSSGPAARRRYSVTWLQTARSRYVNLE